MKTRYNANKPTTVQSFVIDVLDYLSNKNTKLKSNAVYKNQLDELFNIIPEKFDTYEMWTLALWDKVYKKLITFGYVHIELCGKVYTQDELDEFGKFAFVDTNLKVKKSPWKLKIGQQVNFKLTPHSKPRKVTFVYAEPSGDKSGRIGLFQFNDNKKFVEVDALTQGEQIVDLPTNSTPDTTLSVTVAKKLGKILSEADRLNFNAYAPLNDVDKASPFPFFHYRMRISGKKQHNKATYDLAVKAHAKAVKFGLMDKEGCFIKSKYPKNVVKAFEDQFEF